MAWKMNKSPEEKLAAQLETVLMDIDREVLLDELLKNIISVKRGSDKLKRVELTQEELLDNKVTYNVYGVGAFHRKIDIDRVKLDYDIEAFGLGNDPQKYLKYFSAMQNKGTPIKTYTWVFDESTKDSDYKKFSYDIDKVKRYEELVNNGYDNVYLIKHQIIQVIIGEIRNTLTDTPDGVDAVFGWSCNKTPYEFNNKTLKASLVELSWAFSKGLNIDSRHVKLQRCIGTRLQNLTGSVTLINSREIEIEPGEEFSGYTANESYSLKMKDCETVKGFLNFPDRMKSIAIISENSNFVMLDISNADSVSLVASEIPNGIMRKQVTLKVKDVGNLRIKTDPNIEVKVITGIDRITVEPNTTIELEVDEMGMSRVLSKRLSKPRKLQNDLEEYDKQMAAKFKQKFGL